MLISVCKWKECFWQEGMTGVKKGKVEVQGVRVQGLQLVHNLDVALRMPQFKADLLYDLAPRSELERHVQAMRDGKTKGAKPQ